MDNMQVVGMAGRANLIEEINLSKDTWKLKVRITSLWRVERYIIGEFVEIEMAHADSTPKKVVFIMKDMSDQLRLQEKSTSEIATSISWYGFDEDKVDLKSLNT
ncbi:hypothetical protein Lal_00039209 [Lupinus albus]|nr:hypothetical protein Lal_00039209 [Lupinus albus]